MNKTLLATLITFVFVVLAGGLILKAGGPPTDCPSPGDVCPDNTVYIGKTPDGNANYFTTPDTLPKIYSFNDGSSNKWEMSDMYAKEGYCTSTGSSPFCFTGQDNTNDLARVESVEATKDMGPYKAALACYCLGETHKNAPDHGVPAECTDDPVSTNALEGYGHDDWYLPSILELDIMYSNLVSPGDSDNPIPVWGESYGSKIDAANDGPVAESFKALIYWSSSEHRYHSAWRLYSQDGTIYANNQNAGFSVRCVRR